MCNKPGSFDIFYKQWEPRIRTTVRNRTGISLSEIDDVVQIIFMKAFKDKWLDIYDGSNEFSTFVYTYVLKEIQNYINKRDSKNKVRSTGAVRYTSFSNLPVDPESVDNFLDYLCFNGSPEDRDMENAFDSQVFLQIAAERVTYTLFRCVSVIEIIEMRLNMNLTGNNRILEDPLKPRDICAFLGVNISDIKKIDHCIKTYFCVSVEKAIEFLEENFDI